MIRPTLFVIVLAIPAHVFAQTVPPGWTRIPPIGKRVFVITNASDETAGRLEQVTVDRVVLQTPSGRRTIPLIFVILSDRFNLDQASSDRQTVGRRRDRIFRRGTAGASYPRFRDDGFESMGSGGGVSALVSKMIYTQVLSWVGWAPAMRVGYGSSDPFFQEESR